ncbi:iron ABC transporter permease [Deinococcus cellulosilyticus NBRC 106333 = KACC 11606]|uniref:Iron ABC transporter permease n=2 Tax=Deinococcus cellulosilyticus TaxID=401558 RepID=A0A511MWN9_DEIC1|nr:iron ABC transporter permease [Deinococcus cellulosilyticus NBRC 106333 = KACC 11606]
MTETTRFPLMLILSLLLLAFCFALSISIGAARIPLLEVWSLTFHPSDEQNSLIVHTIRLPRALVGMLAGAALAISGAIMQVVTRNPLASPGLLGVNAGAALALLLLVVFFPTLPGFLYVPAAFVGGVGAALLVFGMTSSVGFSPLKLALAGVAASALFSSAASALKILFEQRAQGVLFSLAGSVAGRTWDHFHLLWPWVVAGVILALIYSGRLNLLALGDELSTSLGIKTRLNQLMLTLLAVLLAASAVSVVGPVAFVGLMVPHITRKLVGVNHQMVIPICALLGASLVTIADVAARLIDFPAETPVGILISAIGAPFFIYLARNVRKMS